MTTYVWDETTASRGSQEVASRILKHMEDITTQKHVRAYSDACSMQKENFRHDFKFQILDLSPKRGRPKFSEILKHFHYTPPLDSVMEEKHKDIMCLLPCNPPVFREHFKNLKNWK
uniref:Uncharacterized protein n=1 Tax=Glossina morsitans morsitans TaxID=37546 RepID=A0A1B0FAA7_GLOMM